MSVHTKRRPSKTGEATHGLPLLPLAIVVRISVVTLALLLIVVIITHAYRPLAGALYLSLAGHSLTQASLGSPELVDTALRQLGRARSYTPDNPLIYRRLADVALLQERPKDALVALEQAHRLEPRSRLILRDLLYAAIAAEDLPRAQQLLGEYTGAPADLIMLGDTLFHAGRPEAALQVYRTIGEHGSPSSPLAQVRAAVIAALTGDEAGAAALLQSSGARNPAAVLASIRSGAGFGGTTPWGALLVNGRHQGFQGMPLHLFYGDGWYDPEPQMGRWMRSPGQVLVFSPVAQSVEVRVLLSMIADKASVNVVTDQGQLQVSLNGGPAEDLSVKRWETAVVRLELPAGWSTVTLALKNGNIRPSEHLVGSLDSRELSVGVMQVDFIVP